MSTDKKCLRISGYLFDNRGIRDRFLSWRYFGRWENAESVCLVKHRRGNKGGLDLVVEFNNRRKPVRVSGSNGIKEGLKLAETLEIVRSQAPGIMFFGDYTDNLLSAVEEYRRFENTSEHDPDATLAKARMHLASVDHKKCRKLLRDLLRAGNSLEYPASFMYLESLVEQDEEMEAGFMVRQLLQNFPDDWPTRRLWANYHLIHDTKGTEDVVLDALVRSPDKIVARQLETGLAMYFSREKRYDESLAILDDLIASAGQFDPEEIRPLKDLRDQVFRLKTDKNHRRMETVFKPLRSMAGVIIWLILMALFFLLPASVACYELVTDYRKYGQLEREGVDAASYRFSQSAQKMEFGLIELPKLGHVLR